MWKNAIIFLFWYYVVINCVTRYWTSTPLASWPVLYNYDDTPSGNTFQPNHMPFTPCYRLDSRQVVFNAVSVKRNTYRTVLLENSGTTPIMFHMTSDSDRSVFTFIGRVVMITSWQLTRRPCANNRYTSQLLSLIYRDIMSCIWWTTTSLINVHSVFFTAYITNMVTRFPSYWLSWQR